MSFTVFTVVIAAAVLHAVWNAFVKSSNDKLLGMTAVALGTLPISIGLLPFVPVPAEVSWPYLAASILLHFGYYLFLQFSYRLGDFTQVYPIARGTAPLLVAGVSILFLGVDLSSIEIIAVFLIAFGIMSISFVRQENNQSNLSATILALVTGCFIAAYSLVDGIGARLAETSLGYNCWLEIGTAAIFATFVALKKPGVISSIPLQGKRAFFIGGNATFVAFAMIIWAFTQAPIALVTALREVSIVFAMFIGVFFLKEKLDLVKVCSTVVTFIGVALLRFSK